MVYEQDARGWAHYFDIDDDYYVKTGKGFSLVVVNYWYLAKMVSRHDKVPGYWYAYATLLDKSMVSTNYPLGCHIQLEVAKRRCEDFVTK